MIKSKIKLTEYYWVPLKSIPNKETWEAVRQAFADSGHSVPNNAYPWESRQSYNLESYGFTSENGELHIGHMMFRGSKDIVEPKDIFGVTDVTVLSEVHHIDDKITVEMTKGDLFGLLALAGMTDSDWLYLTLEDICEEVLGDNYNRIKERPKFIGPLVEVYDQELGFRGDLQDLFNTFPGNVRHNVTTEINELKDRLKELEEVYKGEFGE